MIRNFRLIRFGDGHRRVSKPFIRLPISYLATDKAQAKKWRLRMRRMPKQFWR